MSGRPVKKRGRWMIKVGLGIPVLYVLVQLCYGLLGGGTGVVTMPAQISEAGSGITVSGFVVRDEVVLPPTFLPTALCVEEGEWIAAGQTVGYCFASEADCARERQRQRLIRQQQALQAAPAGDALTAYAQGEGSDSAVQAAILRADCTEAEISRKIQRLQAEIDLMTVTPAAEITAPCAGYYYACTDGWESQLTPQALKSLPALVEPEQSPSSGKLIVSNEWYYVANVPTEQVEDCRKGETVAVALFADVPKLTMRIESIRDERGGSSVLILKSDRDPGGIAGLRQVSARLTLHSQRGLRIEKRAIWLNDAGETGVYVLQGAQAVWRPICLIADGGDYYLVRQNDAGGLREGDEVILSDEPLHNGKVIDP